MHLNLASAIFTRQHCEHQSVCLAFYKSIFSASLVCIRHTQQRTMCVYVNLQPHVGHERNAHFNKSFSACQLLLSPPSETTDWTGILKFLLTCIDWLFLSLSPHLLARRRQVSRSGACAPDLVGTRRSQPQERQQLLLHDPVVQRPHPPADRREESAREGDGGGQRKVQDCSVRHTWSMWVLCSPLHTHRRRCII